MGNDDLGEETAARRNDRHGNAPLTRGPDPDKVAHHLATSESPMTSKRRDALAIAMRAGAKIDKDRVREYIKEAGFADLMDLVHAADESRFRKAERWIAIMNQPPSLPLDTCAAKALDNEPTFTLLGRDLSAPNTIVDWCTRRFQKLCEQVSKRLHNIVTPENFHDFYNAGELTADEKDERAWLDSAMATAQAMERWRRDEIEEAGDNLPRWKRPRPIGKSPLLGEPYTPGPKTDGDIYRAVAEAVMPEVVESLIEPKKADNFETESPIRAFTDFQIAGNFAIGKGFRPSLRHLARYLDALERKEGWTFVQVILAANDEGDPTIIFTKTLTEAEMGLIQSAMSTPAESTHAKHVRLRRAAETGDLDVGPGMAL